MSSIAYIKGPSAGRRSQFRAMADRMVDLSEKWSKLGSGELRSKADELRWQARTGVPLKKLLLEAYALVRVAASRTLGYQHYPVQLLGGISLFQGYVAEMQTGEGKTLTAVAPAYLRALPGRGCHVVTVNDYLAGRDAETMGPVYQMLGLTVGCIQSEMEDDERRESYEKDITYGTAKELGFDFLRDRLKKGGAKPSRRRGQSSEASDGEVQRGHYFALVDEADSIFIDEARTPLIIGLMRPNSASDTTLVRWADRAARKLTPDEDYIFEPEKRSVELTEAGCRNLLLVAKPSLLDTTSVEDLYVQIEQALTSQLAFAHGRDYVIHEEEIVIVDESTGRMMQGRKWQRGLHQAVEAKEHCRSPPKRHRGRGSPCRCSSGNTRIFRA